MGGSLSIIEILTVLYYKVLNFSLQNRLDPERDRFILSKGHGGVTLYAILADKGFFPKDELYKVGKKDSILGDLPDMYKIPGVEASTGSLGHGFPFGVGLALAAKLEEKKYRVFTLLGDGECQEGSVWEAAMFTAQHQLDNLVAIVDYNKIQAMDWLDNIVSLEPLAEKWRSFGWEVKEVDGHNIGELGKLFDSLPFVKNKPNLVLAHTIKGKGISFMENVPIWHYRLPNEAEMKIACEQLRLKNFPEAK